jgi:cell division protein FtsB
MGTIKKQFLKYALAAVILILFLVSWLGFGERGFIHLYRMEKERQTYLKKIAELERMNTELMEQIRRLREDREYIETVARRELGLVKDNELIIKFKSGGGE